ncbi:hypothetical protein [Streptococcus cristatus]|nr:hypothetical protein [Streptococcus cristatus]
MHLQKLRLIDLSLLMLKRFGLHLLRLKYFDLQIQMLSDLH